MTYDPYGQGPPPTRPQPSPTPPRSRRLWLVAVVAAAAVAAGGYWFVVRDDSDGGVVTSAPAVGNLGELAQQLDDLGFGCTDYAASATDEDAEFGPPPKESGSCTVEGSAIELTLYEDAAHQEQAIGMAEGVGCAFAESFGISEFHFVNGNLWVLSPDDNLDVDLVERLARALDAEHKQVTC